MIEQLLHYAEELYYHRLTPIAQKATVHRTQHLWVVDWGGRLFISLYVVHERSYDQWNPNADRIVRAASDISFGGHHFDLATVGSFMVPDAAKELPEIQAWCRIRNYGSFLVKRDGPMQQNTREEHTLMVDSSFFEVFPVKVIAGDPSRCLAAPKTVALSRSSAEKYFSAPQMALGQVLILENEERWQVTAVFEDMPVASHFRADMLCSLNGNEEIKGDPPYWAANNNYQGYFLLKKGTDKQAFTKKFEALSNAKIAVTTQNLMGISPEEFAKTGQYARYYLQNLTDIHLHSDLTSELQPNGSIRYVWILSAIAAFILLIACINFMNLATARSGGRAKEVGVRKALGSGRSALIGQFLSESLILSAAAVGIGVLLASISLPYYNELADRTLTMPWSNPVFWATLLGGIGFTGLLAGSYPAFFLSAFQTVQVLKGNPLKSTGGGSHFRSALVVFQFAVSVALIISTLLVFQQLNFIQNKKVGFDKKQVLIIDDAYALGPQINNFKTALLQHPAIEQVTVSSYLPVSSNRSNYTFSKNRSMNSDQSVAMQRWGVDSDYLATLGIELAEGRNFDPARLTDSTGLILNESAARVFGFADPIGQKVFTVKDGVQGSPRPEDFDEFTIIGVVKDFHFESLHDNIGALCLQLQASEGQIALQYKGEETASVLAAVAQQWKDRAPDQPFRTRFMDEAFGEMYEAENRVGQIVGLFSIISVLISCLGLFGLATFTAEQRTKEIGIRKVLGASVAGITGLLAKDFLKLVLIAIVLASPVAWFFMQKWLTDFAYRIDINVWIFMAAGGIAVGIAFLTVGGQAVKAALANPVKALKSE